MRKPPAPAGFGGSQPIGGPKPCGRPGRNVDPASVRDVCHVGGLLQNDELPRVDQGVGRRAVCQGRSLDKLESTAALVGHGVEGYRAAAPQGQGLSALATFA